MGVYVPNTIKPTCYECLARGGNYCRLMSENENVNEYVVRYETSPYFPLVEIETPHGRLIDRDEIRLPEMDTDCDKVRMVSALAATPTVIQEEG